MTYNEIINIARRLDKETQQQIDKEVEERLDILRQGDLNEEEMEKMEECLYMSLVIQEYLDGEYELLDEERELLLAEMEEMYNEYGELLTRAKLEEKVSKKKRMALELMRIRESLFEKKGRVKEVKTQMKENRDNKEKIKEMSSKESMKTLAKEAKIEKAQFKKVGIELDISKNNTEKQRPSMSLEKPKKPERQTVVDKEAEKRRNAMIAIPNSGRAENLLSEENKGPSIADAAAAIEVKKEVENSRPRGAF